MSSKPRLLTILDIVTVVLFLVATWMVFFYAPTEAVMGQVQRVFYFHVAAGWVGMLGFLVAAVVGVIYLITANSKWDIVEVAAVEIGMVFAFINVVTGAIWARPIWNTWWTWDPRLTTATIMLLIYAAYLMLRAGIDDPSRRARFGAVYAIVGFLSVPLTFPNHTSSGDWHQSAWGYRRLRYDPSHAADFFVRSTGVFIHLCRFSMASGSIGSDG
jgi:heme exporter protein C